MAQPNWWDNDPVDTPPRAPAPTAAKFWENDEIVPGTAQPNPSPRDTLTGQRTPQVTNIPGSLATPEDVRMQDPTWEDYARATGAGVLQGVGGVGVLTKHLGKLIQEGGPSSIGYLLEQFGRAVQDDATAHANQLLEGVTPQSKAALDRNLWIDAVKDDKGNVITPGHLNIDWTDAQGGLKFPEEAWNTIKLQLAESLPGTVQGIGTGAALKKGAELALERSTGLAGEAARAAGQGAKLGEGADAAAFGLGEASVGAPQQAMSASQQLDTLTDDQLMAGSPMFRDLYERSLDKVHDPATAAALAREAVRTAFEGDTLKMTAVADFLLGAPMGTYLGKWVNGDAIAKTLAGRIGIGVGGEAAQETAQSGAEQLSQNIAESRTINPSKNWLDDVVNQALMGGISGAVMGGGIALTSKHGTPEAPPRIEPTVPSQVPPMKHRPEEEGATAADLEAQQRAGVREQVNAAQSPQTQIMDKVVVDAADVMAAPDVSTAAEKLDQAVTDAVVAPVQPPAPEVKQAVDQAVAETQQPAEPQGEPAPEEPKSYASTQVVLDDTVAHVIKRAALTQIAPEDLAPGKGIEDRPHITALYGLTDENPDAIRKLLGEGPVTAEVGPIEVFKPEGKPYEVVVQRVDSPDLEALHQKLRELPNENQFPDYKPHITLAYVKPGTGDKYLGIQTGLEGKTLEFGTLEFSSKTEQITPLDLSAKPAIAGEVKPPTEAPPPAPANWQTQLPVAQAYAKALGLEGAIGGAGINDLQSVVKAIRAHLANPKAPVQTLVAPPELGEAAPGAVQLREGTIQVDDGGFIEPVQPNIPEPQEFHAVMPNGLGRALEKMAIRGPTRVSGQHTYRLFGYDFTAPAMLNQKEARAWVARAAQRYVLAQDARWAKPQPAKPKSEKIEKVTTKPTEQPVATTPLENVEITETARLPTGEVVEITETAAVRVRQLAKRIKVVAQLLECVRA